MEPSISKKQYLTICRNIRNAMLVKDNEHTKELERGLTSDDILNERNIRFLNNHHKLRHLYWSGLWKKGYTVDHIQINENGEFLGVKEQSSDSDDSSDSSYSSSKRYTLEQLAAHESGKENLYVLGDFNIDYLCKDSSDEEKQQVIHKIRHIYSLGLLGRLGNSIVLFDDVIVSPSGELIEIKRRDYSVPYDTKWYTEEVDKMSRLQRQLQQHDAPKWYSKKWFILGTLKSPFDPALTSVPLVPAKRVLSPEELLNCRIRHLYWTGEWIKKTDLCNILINKYGEYLGISDVPFFNSTEEQELVMKFNGVDRLLFGFHNKKSRLNVESKQKYEFLGDFEIDDMAVWYCHNFINEYRDIAYEQIRHLYSTGMWKKGYSIFDVIVKSKSSGEIYMGRGSFRRYRPNTAPGERLYNMEKDFNDKLIECFKQHDEGKKWFVLRDYVARDPPTIIYNQANTDNILTVVLDTTFKITPDEILPYSETKTIAGSARSYDAKTNREQSHEHYAKYDSDGKHNDDDDQSDQFNSISPGFKQLLQTISSHRSRNINDAGISSLPIRTTEDVSDSVSDFEPWSAAAAASSSSSAAAAAAAAAFSAAVASAAASSSVSASAAPFESSKILDSVIKGVTNIESIPIETLRNNYYPASSDIDPVVAWLETPAAPLSTPHESATNTSSIPPLQSDSVLNMSVSELITNALSNLSAVRNGSSSSTSTPTTTTTTTTNGQVVVLPMFVFLDSTRFKTSQ